MALLDALPSPQMAWRQWRPNSVLVVLLSVMLVALWLFDVVSVSPNRIVSGQGAGLVEAMGWLGALLVSGVTITLMLLSLQPGRQNYQVALVGVCLLLLLMPFGLIVASDRLVSSDMPQARLNMGMAYWLMLSLLLLCWIELRLRLALPRRWTVLMLLGVALVWWLCAMWALEALALGQEFRARNDEFWRALRQHITLVSVSVAISIGLGLSLAMLMRRYANFQKVAFGVLNFLQTIPSIALFGLMLGPLAWLAAQWPLLSRLGVSGIGWAPALLALVAYSLLPMVRNTYIALEQVSPETLEAARGMGMRNSQRFWQVRLPLALPVLLEGIRITSVQAIGLTAVAALIGAGGLGAFIFQGLGQAAMDMVLLGALPILILALIADAGLGALSDILRPKNTVRPGDAQ
ncbi:osmoprotectant transport system permease protein [Vreelandella subterranea]|uniref:Osmoprotectant transport system permease protein n=1 Tax=Vreelandella subterranea TaxID=416874 RepID=A0A1H9V7W8_9GAMM|nr:ABC transporter permease [Halomonas subterranea]SES17668.1 osmoprotectant transport system permease protein [Halomonas subterranea]